MNARRDAIIDELFAERGGRAALDVVTRFNVVEFASLSVQFEDVTAYLAEVGNLTQAGRERAAVRHSLDISARRERVGALLQGHAPPEHTPTNYADLSEDELIEQLETLLTSAKATRDFKRGIVQTPTIDTEHTCIVPEPGDERLAAADKVRRDALNAAPQRKTRGDGSQYDRYPDGRVVEVAS